MILDLANNRIRELRPYAFGNFRNISRLDLSYNHIGYAAQVGLDQRITLKEFCTTFFKELLRRTTTSWRAGSLT